MLRFCCPACHAVILTPDEKTGTTARCSQCKQLFVVPALEVARVTVSEDCVGRTTSVDGAAKSAARNVNYLHHTRDNDGDVILYFSDPLMGVGGVVSRPW